MNKYRLGMGLFIVSEGSFFVLLILAYAYFRAVTGSGQVAAHHLDLLKTGIYSICLFSSSATMEFASRSLRRENYFGLRLWLLATVTLGAIFLFGQVREYLHLFQAQITISRNIFGTTFFTLTGFHGLHVLFGLVALAILFGLAWAGEFQGRHSIAVEAVSLYWHFVDVVWVVIFTVVYIWAFL